MSFVLNTTSGLRRGLGSAMFSIAIVGLVLFMGAGVAKAQAIAEGFENVAGLPSSGWFQTNRSQPLGASVWSQCSGTAIPPAQGGASTSCALVNFNSTTGVGTISNWLMAPTRTFSNGDTVSFYTRTTSNVFPDRLQLRFSPAGASTNTGTNATDVGDFTTLLVDVDPALDGTYPTVWTQFTATISGLSGPTSGRVAFRYFVENGGPDGDNSNIIGIDTFAYTPFVPTVATDAPVDFNNDSRTDYAVVRNTGGGTGGQVTWFYNLNNSAAPTTAFAWGISTDFFINEDFDNDNRDDIAVWRSGAAGVAAFYIYNSATNTVRVERFGQTGDDPSVVDDYNGDGSADLAVYRAGASAGLQSTWFYRTVANGPVTYVPWGLNGDFPAPGDYDGNGSADFVVQRNIGGGQAGFFTRLSTGATPAVVPFGLSTDVIVPGDYDGDGKTDIATIRGVSGSLQWTYLSSLNGSIQYRTFGLSASDLPTQGDYDGDGRTDVAVWRPSATAGQSAFYSYNSSNGAATIFAYGATGDLPVASYNQH